MHTKYISAALSAVSEASDKPHGEQTPSWLLSAHLLNRALCRIAQDSISEERSKVSHDFQVIEDKFQQTAKWELKYFKYSYTYSSIFRKVGVKVRKGFFLGLCLSFSLH